MSFLGADATVYSFCRPERAVDGARMPDRTSEPNTLLAMQRQAGLTLVELFVTLAVASVLLAVAVPSYNQLMATSRLSTAANDFVSALNNARVEAIRRNNSTQFCSNSTSSNGTDQLGTDCGTSVGAVRALSSDGSASTLIQSSPSLPQSISVASGVKAVRYTGQGLGQLVSGSGPYSGLLMDLSSNRVSTDNHRCLYLTTGSIVSTCTRTGTCPTSEPASCQQ
ncbi:GspH/FimT family pseudopilin [Solimonas terrae]|uniref:Type II secretion system protein H n=1 Tax=Solimonas terrae TaxID=1396819 RepID=A0A6M2BVW9_9GAMM|nr:GspH/FimT family pseudopilin [Solimonas terrae]NGY06283.1 pilus assembly protein FimT [Solimonas terrae]